MPKRDDLRDAYSICDTSGLSSHSGDSLCVCFTNRSPHVFCTVFPQFFTDPMMRHSAPLMRCAGGGQKKGTLRFCVSEEQNARRKRERCVPLSVGELTHALSRRQATGLSTAAPQR